MLTKRQKALQVFKDGVWQYVFCFNDYAPRGPVIITKDRRKAQPADALSYFVKKCGNTSFRATSE